MRRDRTQPAGTLHRITHTSKVLEGNPLGDPVTRELHVYTPHGWSKGDKLPLLVDLVGYTGSGLGHTNWKAFTENVPERLDRLIGTGAMPPVVAAFPDCHTRLGGNQYINSAGMGRYADYVVAEIAPHVEQQFNCGGAGRRGVFGKSSGGFGAMWHGMYHADFWTAIASSAGDSAFETVYLPDVYGAVEELAKHDGSIERFIAHLESAKKLTRSEVTCLMICAMAATYDPDPASYLNIRFPVDLRTAELIPERWRNWLRHDPAVIAAEHLDALRQLKGIYLDCGIRDEFHIQFGVRRICDTLKAAGIDHVHEEFDDGHMEIDYRQDRFLPWLAGVISQ